ncbi:uncharacterized protein [Euwallacea similis]|uniref:uncharacterized protein isoform X2 n=1 Tax=Euwallacea similis TaxID=1736056 RepID=UPI00344E3CC9
MSCADRVSQAVSSSSSNEVLAAASREASGLSDKEREIILGVLTKDEQLRRHQEVRIMKLKAELQNLRRKGALRVSLELADVPPDPDKTCGRCRAELGLVINRGAYCHSCRLRVCKACREYNFRATDWVCVVCHKRMEIQAASGEWMNEFVRKPSRRRDARVYVPAADIIKRTIRRSWTISNPTPRWPALRSSVEARPYNSLPRGQEISSYPSLVNHQNNLKIADGGSVETCSATEETGGEWLSFKAATVDSHQAPICHVSENNKQYDLNNPEKSPRKTRTNPLMSVSLYDHKGANRKAVRRKTEPALQSESALISNKLECETDTRTQTPLQPSNEKEKGSPRHVSFDGAQKTADLAYFRSRSLSNNKSREEAGKMPFSSRSLPEEPVSKKNEETISENAHPAVELCDIEPLSGTVFRKMTVRRRRQHNMRKINAVDSGWRRTPDNDFFDILLPDGEDYRLVFVNSDSSSKEEDLDDNDSSSASSFPIDECDWDYFEPGAGLVAGWGSPFGSPRGCRKRLIDSPLGSPLLQRRPRIRESSDEDAAIAPSPTNPSVTGTTAEAMQCVHQSTAGQSVDHSLRTYTCKSCGGFGDPAPVAQYIPVPIPVPFPVPWGGTSLPFSLYKSTFANLQRCAPGNTNVQPGDLWQYFAQVLPWSMLEKAMIDARKNAGEKDEKKEDNKEGPGQADDEPKGHLECENRGSSASESSTSSDSSGDEGKPPTSNVYNVTGNDRDSDDALPSSDVTDEDEVDRKSSADEKEREDGEESSSGSADTDSNDTGTVADQKPKRFSRVFVVNHQDSSSASGSSGSGESDSSDNDTDTELDCGVVLVNVKQLRSEESDVAEIHDAEEAEDKGEASLLRVRYIGEDHNNKGKARRFNKVKKKGKKGGKNDADPSESFTKESCAEVVRADSLKAEQVCDKDLNNEEQCAEAVDTGLESGETIKIEKDELGGDKYKSEYLYSSSPGLSDVSAESLSSSDVEKESSSRSRKEWKRTDKTGSNGDLMVGTETEEVEGACDDPTGVAAAVIDEQPPVDGRNGAGAKYTSLVMITSDVSYQQVNVVTTDTTRVVPGGQVVVSHTNRQDECAGTDGQKNHEGPSQLNLDGDVTVITSAETLSAFEEGLADDDSWVENLSYDDDDFPTEENSSSGEEVTLTCSAVVDQEDELRGYHRTAIDFTLHTIVEESCEDSEIEQAPRRTKKDRPASATDLEKYFFYGLGDGPAAASRDDAFSETSSIYSEGMESLGGNEENSNENSEELASSRLEKYFLSGFMGFTSERRDSDGSVGSDSEGKPSPEQRRKRLVRARGTGRSHSNSLDNLLGNPDLAVSDPQQMEAQNDSEDSSSSDSDTFDEVNGFDKSDAQFDTVKRKKSKKPDIKNLETTQEERSDSDVDDDRNKTPQPHQDAAIVGTNLTSSNPNQQSRDSGFVGSCDDLLKDPQEKTVFIEEKRFEKTSESLPPNTSLTRKDSFNNWSSDEETNLMMSKMRQFFKTMVKPATPNLNDRTSPKPSPRMRNRCKPAQLVYFENELTRLMKTVPGIRDDQVREIVEYLSSEDTWSDSYDSSDYTSSDLEGACSKSALQQQISDSCKQIINKFDNSAEDEEGDAGDGGIGGVEGMNKETAFVYQKLMASFEKIATTENRAEPTNSPPLIEKVMHHIGSRLVALMHEVSSGESHASNSPKGRTYHRRLQQKLSNASTTDEDSSSTSDTNLPDNLGLLPRSQSHDLLVGEAKNQSMGGASEISEEREASDCERFSWRGSFESALLASDSRNRLSLISTDGSTSAIAAKRRSAGDLLFSHTSLSREQLDRVRSCGSIGGSTSEDRIWASKPNRRRSSVPDATSCSGAEGEDEEEEMDNRATLPRSLQTGPQTTNSLPRLPTTSLAAAMQKAQSHHFLAQNVKSARYRPPGFAKHAPAQPKRAVSAPGLQPSHQRRGRRSLQSNIASVFPDEISLSEAHSSPMLTSRSGSKNTTPSPVALESRRKTASLSSQEWSNHEDDGDRLMSLNQTRSSLSSLGLRSDSMASVYSGADDGRYGSVTVRGQVEFGLQYNYKAGALEIQIKQCKDLAPVDVKRNRSDPYVKVYLLPDKSKSGKRKTKVKKHTLNPVFDECLKFHMSINELELRTLWISVWHSDMFGRNDFLGEVTMALENKVFDDPMPKWYNLQERSEPFDDMLSFKGDIIVCLKFVPPDMTVHKKGKKSRGALHILVKEAKALSAVKANGTSDPFCKSYLLPDKGRNAKQKTPVIKKNVNPVWNYTFVYDDVTLQELAERSLELTVWDHDRLASNEFLGMVRFSLGTGKHYGKSVDWMDSTGKELNLWKSMLERPNFWVEGCVPLRPSIGSRVP